MNPIRQKVYKCVYPSGMGGLCSINDRVRQSHWLNLVYTPQQITRPNVGKIFAFADIGSAETFANLWNKTQIWECEGYGVTVGKTRLNDTDIGLNTVNVVWFWQFGEAADNKTHIMFCPSNTVFCKSIKLIKQL